jgi:hypothetical protein
VRRRLAAVGALLLLLPVVVIGAAVGTVLPSVAVGPIPAGGALGLAAAAQQAGFAGQALRTAVAVGLAESGGDPAAKRHNPPTPGCPAGSVDRGGWQLNSCHHPEVTDACAYQLACAATETWRISAGGRDWTPWIAYTSGAWHGHLQAADRAIAALTVAALPPGYGTPGPCGLAPAADYAKQLITAGFGITQIGGCDPDFRGHVAGSDHYPDQRGQAHALDVMVGDDSALGWHIAAWAAANAAALQVTYVIFAGHIVDFRVATPAWHRCRDPAGSCARQHFRHVHISFAH